MLAAKPTAAYDAQWGGCFRKPEVFTRLVYTSLKQAPSQADQQQHGHKH